MQNMQNTEEYLKKENEHKYPVESEYNVNNLSKKLQMKQTESIVEDKKIFYYEFDLIKTKVHNLNQSNILKNSKNINALEIEQFNNYLKNDHNTIQKDINNITLEDDINLDADVETNKKVSKYLQDVYKHNLDPVLVQTVSKLKQITHIDDITHFKYLKKKFFELNYGDKQKIK